MDERGKSDLGQYSGVIQIQFKWKCLQILFANMFDSKLWCSFIIAVCFELHLSDNLFDIFCTLILV